MVFIWKHCLPQGINDILETMQMHYVITTLHNTNKQCFLIAVLYTINCLAQTGRLMEVISSWPRRYEAKRPSCQDIQPPCRCITQYSTTLHPHSTACQPKHVSSIKVIR